MRIVGLAFGAVVVSATQAAAQEAQPLSASLSANVTYDTDVARSSAQTAALRGLVPEDTIFTPTLSVHLDKSLGPERVFLHAAAGYDFYRRNKVLSRERLDLNGGAQATLGSCQATLSGGFSRHQSDLQDLSFDVVRNIEQNKSVSLETTCPKTIGLIPTVTVSNNWDDNSAAQRQTSNYRTFEVTGGVSYARPIFGRLTLQGDFQSVRFPDRVIPAGGPPLLDGYSLYGVGAVFERKLGARIEGTLQLSYVAVHPNSTTVPGFSGLTYLGDLTFRPSGRLAAHVSIGRDARPSNRLDTSYNVTRHYLADLGYTLGSRIGIKVGAEQKINDFRGGALVAGVDLTHDNLKAVFVAGHVNLGRHLGLVLDARRETRMASIAAYNYRATRVGLTVTAAF